MAAMEFMGQISNQFGKELFFDKIFMTYLTNQASAVRQEGI
jgi:hypothetical protein